MAEVDMKCDGSPSEGQSGGVDASGAAAPAIPCIIDTDPGVDDMMALLFALACPELEILGLTIVMGNNNDMDLLARNACLALEVAGRTGIPVFKGAARPRVGEYRGQSGIVVHGDNGLGGVATPEPRGEALRCAAALQKEKQADDAGKAEEDTANEAAAFIRRCCRSRPGEVTVITLGPLTNLAAALEGDDAWLADCRGGTGMKRLVIMGGDTRCVGNKAPGSEANVNNDPEAARLVFEAPGIDIVMAGLRITHQVAMHGAFRRALRDGAGTLGRFLFAVTQHYVDIHATWGVGPDRVPMHDISAVMAVVRPGLFRESQRVRVDVETKGDFTRGLTLADWRGQWKDRPPQTTVLMGISDADADAFRALVVERIAKLNAAGGDNGFGLLKGF